MHAMPDGFTDEAKPFMPPELDDADCDGLWHVTVARDAVIASGLRSRRQLGGAVQGLGGGHDNQAPHLVSLTWSSAKAAEIEEALKLAALAANDVVAPSEIFSRTASRYRTDWFGQLVRAALARVGVPPEITGEEWLEGLDEWLDANVVGGEAKYAFLQEMDDAMEREFDRTDCLPSRVGLTAPFAAIRAVDPSQVCTLRIALHLDARAEAVPEEEELRLTSSPP